MFKKRLRNDKSAETLWHASEDKAVLETLPKAPMPMTLLAIFYEKRHDVPSNITNLYEMFTELLLGKWDEHKNIKSISEARARGTFLN